MTDKQKIGNLEFRLVRLEKKHEMLTLRLNQLMNKIAPIIPKPTRKALFP